MAFPFLSLLRAPMNRLVLAGLLATSATGAMSQTTPVAPSDASMPPTSQKAMPHGERMGHHDPAKMQAMVAKHHADLKAKLKLTSAQEGAWTSFTAAMQPVGGMGKGMGWHQSPEQRAELDKLTTPERIDKMRALRTQRMTEMTAAMDKRAEATKTFYAVLSPDQKKVFDTEHKMHSMHGGRHGGGHHGGMEHRKG